MARLSRHLVTHRLAILISTASFVCPCAAVTVDETPLPVVIRETTGTFLTPSAPDELSEYELQSGRLVRRMQAGEDVGRMVLSPDERLLAVRSYQDLVVRLSVRAIHDGAELWHEDDLFAEDFEFDASGRRLMVVAGGAAGLRDAETGALLHELAVPGRIRAAALAPDASEIAVVLYDGRVLRVDVETGAVVDTQLREGTALRYSADGTRLAIAGERVFVADVVKGRAELVALEVLVAEKGGEETALRFPQWPVPRRAKGGIAIPESGPWQIVASRNGGFLLSAWSYAGRHMWQLDPGTTTATEFDLGECGGGLGRTDWASYDSQRRRSVLTTWNHLTLVYNAQDCSTVAVIDNDWAKWNYIRQVGHGAVANVGRPPRAQAVAAVAVPWATALLAAGFACWVVTMTRRGRLNARWSWPVALTCLAIGSLVTVATSWGLVLYKPKILSELRAGTPRVVQRDDEHWVSRTLVGWGVRGRVEMGPIWAEDLDTLRASLSHDGADVEGLASADLSLPGRPPAMPLQGNHRYAHEMGTGWPFTAMSWRRERDPTMAERLWYALPVGAWPATVLLPTKPLIAGFLVNSMCYGTLAWAAFLGVQSRRRQVRLLRGVCPTCLYPIGTSDVCSECGGSLHRKRRAA